jgi:hypothetical protein
MPVRARPIWTAGNTPAILRRGAQIKSVRTPMSPGSASGFSPTGHSAGNWQPSPSTRQTGRHPRRQAARTRPGTERSSAIRARAKQQRTPVRDRGRIPASVIEQHEATSRGG